MGWSSARRVHCTLCGAGFGIRWGEMVNPADRLCDACIVSLWEETPSEAELASRCRELAGMDPAVVAATIVRKVDQLRELVSDRAELERMLAARAEAGGAPRPVEH